MINYDSMDSDKKKVLKNQLIKNATSLGEKIISFLLLKQ